MTLCDACLGHWLNRDESTDEERRIRQERAAERADAGEVAGRALGRAMTAQERAWLGEKIRDAVMLTAPRAEATRPKQKV